MDMSIMSNATNITVINDLEQRLSEGQQIVVHNFAVEEAPEHEPSDNAPRVEGAEPALVIEEEKEPQEPEEPIHEAPAEPLQQINEEQEGSLLEKEEAKLLEKPVEADIPEQYI